MSKGFWSSSHKWMYIKLAWKFKVTPSHVYRLAHGDEAQCETDEKIMYELKEHNIIHKREHHRHHHKRHRNGGG